MINMKEKISINYFKRVSIVIFIFLRMPEIKFVRLSNKTKLMECSLSYPPPSIPSAHARGGSSTGEGGEEAITEVLSVTILYFYIYFVYLKARCVIHELLI